MLESAIGVDLGGTKALFVSAAHSLRFDTGPSFSGAEFAARSCHRRYFCDASNCSPLCFTSAPMISKLFFGSFEIMSTASK